MPADTIKKNIDKATGNLEGVSYEEIRYEGYGIGGAAIIVDCMTDNRVRTVAEVRHAFSKYGGNLGTEGSVAFQFRHCGQFVFAPGTSEDKVMEVALEAGADDVIADDDGAIEVLCAPADFEAVQGRARGGRPEARGRRGDDAAREHRRARAARTRQRMQKLLDVHRGPRRHAGASIHNAEICAVTGSEGRSRPMKVLVIGGGGREHALAWKLAQSPRVQTVYVAPGNAGTAPSRSSKNVAITDLDQLADFALAEKIALTVVGPEAPLAAGVGRPASAPRGLRIFGPTQAAAQLESSKAFAKEFMQRHAIPTAALRGLRRRRRGACATSTRTARRSSSRPTAWPPARAWSSRRRAPRRTRRSTRCSATPRTARRRAVVIEEFLEGEEASFIVRLRRPQRAARWPPARTTSASATATPARTPAAWAPTRRRRWSRRTCTRG